MNLQEGVVPKTEEEQPELEKTNEIKEDLNKEIEKAVESGTELIEKEHNIIEEQIKPDFNKIINNILKSKLDTDDKILKSLNDIDNSIKEDMMNYIDSDKVSNDIKCIEAYYTPGRKPRKRDLTIENKVLAARGNYSENEIRQRVKTSVESIGLKYKDKWCKLVYVTNKELLKDVINNSGNIHIEKG